jgi:hypothetical protein
MRNSPMTEPERNIASDIVDALESATAKWTRQKKSEERHPGNVRYRVSRMTREPRINQKEAAGRVLESAYMAASRNGDLPALARQIYYQARPRIMALTDDKKLDYDYFSQTLLPNYIEEHGVAWNVVYDARGHFEEPHTNRKIGCGTIAVGSYLRALRAPEIVPAEFAAAAVDVIGPAGGIAGVLFCEKEGFDPLFKAVNLANRHDLMIVSTKGVSNTSARRLIDDVCGGYDLPLFVLHDFDEAGFMISGTLQRDTRRYQFLRDVEVVDLGLRLSDIEGLEREPAAATKTSGSVRRARLTENGASDDEIEILLNERVELNAMTSDALVEMIARKLREHGLKKVIPDADTLAEAYRAFRRSDRLRERFEEMEAEFDAEEDDAEDDEDDGVDGIEEEGAAAQIPKDLRERVEAVLAKHADLRWDDAVQVVLDETALTRVRGEKVKSKKKSGDFSEDDDEEVSDP